MAQLGFLGLGIMGSRMARHLLKGGHEVALWTHSQGKAFELAREGKGVVCKTPREVADHADFIFYCVGDSEMSRAVALGPDGILAGARPESVTCDCSTISPAVSQEIHAAYAAKGLDFLDAPCTGSTGGAEGGTLTFMIGGSQAAFDRAKPYLQLMGKRFYYCGSTGQGLHAKLTQNLILGNLMEAFAEGMVLATKNGINPELMLDILDNSAAKSSFITFKAPFILSRNFGTAFSTKWLHKDIGLALESAQAGNLPLPVTAVTQQMLQMAIAKGRGDDDICSTIRTLEEWAGVEVKK
jgi:3-hydroxyisobutyrate dehydrogenase-like beta-hydroxyacid dehydrogenase